MASRRERPLGGRSQGQQLEVVGVARAEWTGSLPPPAVLQEYEAIHAGLAERIVRMAEVESSGTHELDEARANAEIATAKQGQVAAIVLTGVALIASIYFFAVGDPIAGSVLFGLPIVMLVRALLGR